MIVHTGCLMVRKVLLLIHRAVRRGIYLREKVATRQLIVQEIGRKKKVGTTVHGLQD